MVIKSDSRPSCHTNAMSTNHPKSDEIVKKMLETRTIFGAMLTEKLGISQIKFLGIVRFSTLSKKKRKNIDYRIFNPIKVHLQLFLK